MVLDRQNCDEEQCRTSEQELAEDLLAVVTVFVAKNNGRRAQENRRKRAAEIARSGAEPIQEEAENDITEE